jgi:ribosomal protein S27E
MPELRCPECGNELLPSKHQDAVDPCVCQKCGRNVYSWSKAEVRIKCSKCGKDNKATVIR